MTSALWFIHWTLITLGMFWMLYRMHLRQITDLSKPWVILGLALTLSASLLGVCGTLDLGEMARRSRLDYDFERRCWDVAALGLLFTLAWAWIARNLYACITLVVALYLTATWTLICATL